MADLDDPPISELQADAISLHELYITYVRAGFSKKQAFKLIFAVFQQSLYSNGDDE